MNLKRYWGDDEGLMIQGGLVLACHSAAEKILTQKEYMQWRSIHRDVVMEVLPMPPFVRPKTKDYKYKTIWPIETIWRTYCKRVVEAFLSFQEMEAP